MTATRLVTLWRRSLLATELLFHHTSFGWVLVGIGRSMGWRRLLKEWMWRQNVTTRRSPLDARWNGPTGNQKRTREIGKAILWSGYGCCCIFCCCFSGLFYPTKNINWGNWYWGSLDNGLQLKVKATDTGKSYNFMLVKVPRKRQLICKLILRRRLSLCHEEMPTEEEHWHWGSSHDTGSLPVVGMDQRRSITFAAAFTCVPRNTKWYSYFTGSQPKWYLYRNGARESGKRTGNVSSSRS